MNTFEMLVFLVFFAPMFALVALNLLLYSDTRYTLQPPAPRLASPAPAIPAPAATAAAEITLEPELRKAA